MAEKKPDNDEDEPEEEEEVKESITDVIARVNFEDRPAWIQNLAHTEGPFDSPININVGTMKEIDMCPLEWHNINRPPKKMQLTNTGHTLILSGKWRTERPYLTAGPLDGNYVISQIHFHWGRDDMEGSEHTADGVRYPVEMHVVFFKSAYLTQEAALKERDGMIVVAYLFQLGASENPRLESLLNGVRNISQAHTAVKMTPVPISFLAQPFSTDYFMYWGSVTTSTCSHLVLWFISRITIPIATTQTQIFRTLNDPNDLPLKRNFRNLVNYNPEQIVFHVCPVGQKYSSLLPAKPELPRTGGDAQNNEK